MFHLNRSCFVKTAAAWVRQGDRAKLSTNLNETSLHHCGVLQLGSVANMSLNKVQRWIVVLLRIVDLYRFIGIGDKLGTARRVLNHNKSDGKWSEVKNTLRWDSAHSEMQAILEITDATGGIGMFW